MHERLQAFMERARSAPYYQKLWGEIRAHQLDQYPVSGKKLFDPNSIHLSFVLPESNITYYYFSAGTTGSPRMVPFTNKEWLARAIYRGECYRSVGVTPHSRVAILLSFGPWIAGPSAQEALLNIGCTVFPIGQLSDDEEVVGLFSIFNKHKIDTLVTAPSLAHRFCHLYSLQKNKPELHLKRVITSGEVVTDTLRAHMRTLFGVEIFSSYASSESFIGIECVEHHGFHYNPEEIIIETIPTEKTPGNQGDIAITVLSSDIVPVIRYPLGDIGTIDEIPCACGNPWPKILWQGRDQEMFGVAGQVSVHPYQTRNALASGSVHITKCDIELFNKDIGRDLIVFKLFTNEQLDRSTLAKKADEFHNLIKCSSMDLHDIIHQGIVELQVTMEPDPDTKPGPKTKVKIYDKRTETR